MSVLYALITVLCSLFGFTLRYYPFRHVIRDLLSDRTVEPVCRHVSTHEELLLELLQWHPCLTVVLPNGPVGMEGVFAVRENHPPSSVFWFSDDIGFGMMSHRLECAYFSVKPVTREKLQRVFRRCAHVGITF